MGKATEVVRAVMSDGKVWTLRGLAFHIGKPEYGISSTLRGMINRKEVRAIKPKIHPAPYEYQLNEKAKATQTAPTRLHDQE